MNFGLVKIKFYLVVKLSVLYLNTKRLLDDLHVSQTVHTHFKPFKCIWISVGWADNEDICEQIRNGLNKNVNFRLLWLRILFSRPENHFKTNKSKSNKHCQHFNMFNAFHPRNQGSTDQNQSVSGPSCP